MNHDSSHADDSIPVLSDVVIPGHVPAESVTRQQEPPADVAPANQVTTLSPEENTRLLHERLNFHAAQLMTDMGTRIEQLIEEELAHAHATALETARESLHARLRVEMQERLTVLIDEVMKPADHS